MMSAAQNNVLNASTPGYARQGVAASAMPFDLAEGRLGGVRAGAQTDSRDLYAEGMVRRQASLHGNAQQRAESFAEVESVFDIDNPAAIAGSMNGLFRAFSSWSVDPNGAGARESVLAAARQVATSFRTADAALNRAGSASDRQILAVTSRINAITAKIRELNIERRRGGADDSSIDARMHNALEALSELIDFSAIPQEDGTITVLAGGEVALVIGENQQQLSAESEGGRAVIRDAGGADVTLKLSEGRLGGLLDVRNRIIPDAESGLDRLAQSFADKINALLASGQTKDGEAGLPLFVYDASRGPGATIAVNPDIIAGHLAPIDPGPPAVANGIALKLAALATPADDSGRIDGASFAEFYGSLSGTIGRERALARDTADLQAQRLIQAKSLRQEISRVSLDEEAIHIIEFQRAYQAAAQMVKALDELTQTTIGLLR